jgi:hypothetical protein
MTNPISRQKRRNRWLNWEPKGLIPAVPCNAKPAKPTELGGSVGFAGINQGLPEKISDPSGKGDVSNAPSLDTRSTTGDQVKISSQAEEEMPDWRRELSRRLKEIRERRQATGSL